VSRDRDLEILLVEDHEADVQLIVEGLAETTLAYKLRVVEDGQAAIDYLNQRPPYVHMPLPDLILLDLNLPKKSGTEVLDEIKTDSRFRRIPVLVLTSSQAEADVWAAYDHGANSYLKKPGSLQEIYDLMRTIEHYWAALSVLPPRGPLPPAN
jgi:CheY-like chemotaxis protein